MRRYSPNSPEAVARIVVLALVADGRLDAAEIDMLRRMRAYDRIGITEERFLEVLREFCSDLLAGARSADGRECELDGETLLSLLGDLDDPLRHKEVLRLMLDVIRADGRLHPGETSLFWQALESWRMRISDVVYSVPRVVRRARGSARNRKGAMPRAGLSVALS